MSAPASTITPTRRRSFTSSGFTYELVARELGLRLCTGSCQYHSVTSERMHQRGHVSWSLDPPEWIIHWGRTQMSKRGLYQFLRLASLLLFRTDTVHQERWLALYRTDQHARRLARKFRVRIPTEFGKREKARVRLDLAKIEPLDREFPEQRELVRRVKAWARS